MNASAKGRAAAVLVLCRGCVQYVFAGAAICPHCGGNTREASTYYSEGGFAVMDAMECIEQLRDRPVSSGRE
jgi:hypothetical protein